MASPDQPAPFQLLWQLDFTGGSSHIAFQVISMISHVRLPAVTLLAFLFTVAASPPFFNPSFVVEQGFSNVFPTLKERKSVERLVLAEQCDF